MKRGRSLAILIGVTAIVALVTLSANQAHATDPIGVSGPPIASGTINGHINVNTSNHHDSVITFQKVTIQPGGTTGWHSHDAEVIALVATGTVTLTDHDCSVREIGPTSPGGSGFTENPGHVHKATNNTGGVVEVWVTYVSRPGAPLRVSEPDPGCSS